LAVHVISYTSDAGIVNAALIDELEDVVDAGEDIVHQYNTLPPNPAARVGARKPNCGLLQGLDAVVKAPLVLVVTLNPTLLVNASKIPKSAFV
jgi:hypothetical protein